MDQATAAPAVDATNVKDKLSEFLKWGSINFESANGIIQSNCRALEFKSADEMNAYFEKHPGTFNAQIFSLGDRIVCIANRSMEEEEQLQMQDYAGEFQKKVEELAAGRKAAKLEQEKVLEDRLANLERLQEVGKKCENHHAPLVEEVRKLKSENAKLRKAAK